MRKSYLSLVSLMALLLALFCAAGLPLRAVGLDEAPLVDEQAATQESEAPAEDDENDFDGSEDVELPSLLLENGQQAIDGEDARDADGEELRDEQEALAGEDEPAPEDAPESVEPSVEEAAAAPEADAPQVADEELTAQSTVAEADAYAKSHAGDIVDGRYAITSKLDSSYSIDVKGGSTANGTSIILYTAKVSDNQRWDIAHTSDGYVTIKSARSGKYLQVGWDGEAWKLVQNKRLTKERSQLWIIARESDGSFKISSAVDLRRAFHIGGGKAKNSANVIAYAKKSDEGDAHRRWNITVTTDILDSEAKAHKEDLANGTYVVASAKDSALALAMKKASVENSAPAVLGNKGPTLCQGWTISHTSAGYVTIINAKSGKALDVKGGKAKAGAAIIQWTDKKGSARNQLWIASKGSDGTITFTSALVGAVRYVLTASADAPKNGTTIELGAASGALASQAWTATKAPAQYAHARDVADGTYAIATALNSSKVLDVSGSSTKSGAGVKLWTSKSATNQYWELTHDGQGIVHLTNKNSKKELAYEDGALVQASSSVGWVFEAASAGQYRIRKAGTSKYLDVKRSDVDNKTNKVILYGKGSGKNQLWSLKTAVLSTVGSGTSLSSSTSIGPDMLIMGVATITQAQAVKYINNNFASYGRSLPKKWRDDGVTVASLVKLFWEEGAAEGVRGDIALAQSLHETGWFQFGGDALPEQYNFAGIGTTGGGVKGHYFKNAREGIRGQIQHLKAYASTAPLNNTCVDPRFEMVSRGIAPTIRGLTGRWAVPGYSDVNGTRIYYHDYIVTHLKGMAQL